MSLSSAGEDRGLYPPTVKRVRQLRLFQSTTRLRENGSNPTRKDREGVQLLQHGCILFGKISVAGCLRKEAVVGEKNKPGVESLRSGLQFGEITPIALRLALWMTFLSSLSAILMS